MFIGHYGVSYAAKAVNKQIPLWLLFIAVQLVLTDRVIRQASENVLREAGIIMGLALAKKLDTDLLTIIDGFSTIIPSSGNTGALAMGHLMAGKAIVRGNATEPGDKAGPVVGVVHEWQWHDIREDAIGLATGDIRLTTRYYEDYLGPALFGSMHECGHGLYERGVSPALERTPLASGVSLGLHESQSRLWENLVGRSLPFWRHFYPELAAAFPDVLGGVDVERFHRAVNRVRPSLIRVEADEATYSLHVILRFELEQEIVEGRLDLRDLPEAWNARMMEYLGVDVPDDAHGVLQDIHWAGGTFGYFPTYSLGTVMSVQIWEAARQAIPDLDAQIEAGELGGLREWLRESLHRHGRKLTPKETLERVAGGPLDPEPFLRYLKAKLGEIYGLP